MSEKVEIWSGKVKIWSYLNLECGAVRLAEPNLLHYDDASTRQGL
ncbi:hypothetical protein [Siminovitchia fortis]|nr:hypothetical protein [Siminovitchia fortis]